MHLPNVDKAYIDMRKITEYVLNPDDPRGRDKARVFKSALNITKENADVLKTAILREVIGSEAVKGEQDFYGQRYTVDCRIKTDAGEAFIRTGWIVKRNEDFPRLTTCYVMKKRSADL